MKILLSLCVVGFFVLVGVIAKYYDRKIANEGHRVIAPEEQKVRKVVTREEYVEAVKIRREETRNRTLARSQVLMDKVKDAIQEGLDWVEVQYDPGKSYIVDELQRLYPFLTFKAELDPYIDHRNMYITWEEKTMEEQIIIRAFSELNQWIDLLVITDEKNTDKAVEAINKGFDNFNEGVTDATYSEAITEELEKSGIDYSLIVGEIDYEGDDSNVIEEYERLAERLISGFKNSKTIIF